MSRPTTPARTWPEASPPHRYGDRDGQFEVVVGDAEGDGGSAVVAEPGLSDSQNAMLHISAKETSNGKSIRATLSVWVLILRHYT